MTLNGNEDMVMLLVTMDNAVERQLRVNVNFVPEIFDEGSLV